MTLAYDTRRKNRKLYDRNTPQVTDVATVILTRPAIRGMKQRPRNSQKAKDRGYPE